MCIRAAALFPQGPGSPHGGSGGGGGGEVAVEEMAERLTQTEQLVTQLKEMIREKDAALRTKDDQLKVAVLVLQGLLIVNTCWLMRGQCQMVKDIRHVGPHDKCLFVCEINMKIDFFGNLQCSNTYIDYDVHLL